MTTEFERLLADNANPPTKQCLLTNTHEAHGWWYTSWGGGHMLDAISEPYLEREKGLKRYHCNGLTESVVVPESKEPKLEDIDWSRVDAQYYALHLLRVAFAKDPVLCMLDDNHRLKLANVVVNGLLGAQPIRSMYHAANYVEYTVIPKSIYGVFGSPVAYRAATCVQQVLYPKTYTDDGGKLD